MQRHHPPHHSKIPNYRKPDLLQLGSDVDEGIYTSYSGPCMIPSLDSDGFEETNEMSYCHVIGGKFLEFIASKGSVMAWPFNGRQISHAVLPAEWTVTDAIRPEVSRLRPQSIGVNSHPCKSPFACHEHDDPVFKQIDAPKTFDPQLQEHQFLLAFRGVAGASALAEGALTHITKLAAPWTNRRARRQRDSVSNNQRKMLEESLRESQVRAAILRDELKAWQSMYKANDLRSIVSCHTSCTTQIRLAVSSVVHVPEGIPVVASILPRSGDESAEYLCDVILTSRKAPLTGSVENTQQTQGGEQTAQLKDFAERLTQVLTKDPTVAIPELVQNLSLNPTSFFFISPDDYRSISEEGQAHIESEMARIAQAILSP